MFFGRIACQYFPSPTAMRATFSSLLTILAGFLPAGLLLRGKRAATVSYDERLLRCKLGIGSIWLTAAARKELSFAQRFENSIPKRFTTSVKSYQTRFHRERGVSEAERTVIFAPDAIPQCFVEK